MLGGMDLRQFLGGGGAASMFFDETYRCYSMAVAGRSDLEQGDKTRLHVQFPMQFQLRSVGGAGGGRTTHVGVMEFTAEEGKVFLPHWVMSNLVLREGEMVTVRNVQLPKAKFVKFQPHSKDFLDISNPRAVLEMKLRAYSCLTVGDVIVFNHAGQNYALDILELKPANAVSIVETDTDVDFAPPVDYVEPVYKKGGAAGAAAAVSSSSSGVSGLLSSVSLRGDGTSSNPIVFDDDEMVDMGGSAFGSGPSGASSGERRPAAGRSPSGDSGESAAKRARSAALTTSPGISRLPPSSASAAAAAAGGMQPSASPPPIGGAADAAAAARVVSFSGAGRRLSDGPGKSSSPSFGSSSTGAAAGAARGVSPGNTSTPPSPLLHPLAGGVVLSAASSTAQKPPRTLNRFEQARQEKAFQGAGRTLR